MPEQHRALDWLARRHAGESVGLIAHRAGVSKSVVITATRRYGPFPRPTQLLYRSRPTDADVNERTRRWVDARRRGRLVTDIAADDGVSHQIVSRATTDHGPFPAPEVVEEWVAARQLGRTLPAIADQYEVRVEVVRQRTKPHGPFHGPGGRLPEGVVGLNGIARMAGVSAPTLRRWQRTRRLPEPDFTTAKGRPIWLTGTAQSGLTAAPFLHECGVCGARCLSLGHHMAFVHAG